MATAAYSLPAPGIDLNIQTQGIPDGDLLTWYNQGTVKNGTNAGAFLARGTPPVIGTVQGRRAVTFNGNNGYLADFTMPGEYTGTAAYTVSMWVLNPGIQGTERIFGWTRLATADRQAAIFCYGNNANYGVCNHWGTQNDMGFDRGVPILNTWHSIIITYSGISGWEKVYVDGVLNAIERKPDEELNNIEFGGPVWLACTSDPSGDQNFSGSLASLQLFNDEASFDEVTSMSYTAVPGARVHPTVVNGSFEAGLDWAPVLPAGTFINMGDNRIIPGWALADTFIDGTPARAGIGVVGKNIALVAGGGNWDNGNNHDGNRVLALNGTATAGRSVSQWINLNGGSTYRVRIFANAKTGGSALLKFYLDGTQEGSDMAISPVDMAGSFENDFWKWEDNIVPANDGVHELKIEQALAGTQNVLLVDKVEVINWNPQVPIVVTPNPLDFGQVAKTKTVDKEIKVRNLSSLTLDLWQYSRMGANAAMISLPDSPVPGTNSSNVANIRIDPYESYQFRVRFIADAATTGTKSGQLRLRWRNGPFIADYDLPWTAEQPQRPYVRNGSFEQPITNRNAYHPFSYYNQMGDNVEIPFWSAAKDGIGVGERSNHPYVNNGTLINGRQALWIHNNKNYFPQSYGVSQMVAGWDKATTYTISLWANARNTGNWNPAQLQVKINGSALQPRNGASYAGQLAASQLSATTCSIPTGGTYYNPQYTFTPPNTDNGMYLVEILGLDNGSGNNANRVLNVDQVQIFTAKTANVANNVSVRASTSVPQLPGTLTVTGSQGLQSGNMTLNVFNQGGTALTINNFRLTGSNASQFKVVTTNASFTVNPFGNRAQISVAMVAKDVGGIGDCSFLFNTNEPVSTAAIPTTQTVTVPLYGTSINYPVFANNSFELPVAFWANDGTWRNHLHSIQGQVPGWSQTGNGNGQYGIAIPIDPDWQNLYWNNGAPGKGTQAGWMVTSTSNASGDLAVVHNWRQTVYGFIAGQTYTVTMYVNARNYNDGMVEFALHYGRDFSNLADLLPRQELTAVGAVGDFTKPFKQVSASFTTTSGGNMGTNGSVAFQIQVPNQVDESALLIDAIEIVGPPPNAIKSWSSFE